MKHSKPNFLFVLLVVIAVVYSCKKKEEDEGTKPPLCAVVYKDIVPDVILKCPAADSIVTDSSAFYCFDFNSDSNNEISIYAYSHYGNSGVDKQITISSADAVSMVNHSYNPTENSCSGFLPSNTTIDNSLKWKTYSLLYNGPLNLCTSSETDKYLPVKLVLNNETHYGWIHIDKTNASLTIKGYAYNECADKSILAGQKN